MAVNEDLIKVNKGDEIKIVKSGNKVYLETLDGDRLSGATTSGFTGRKNRKQFVFRDEDAARFYLDLRGYFPEGEKPDEDVEVDTEVKTEVEGLDGAYDIVDESVTDVINDVEFGDTDAENAAEVALDEVGEGAAAAFGGDKIGDTVQNTSSFTDSEATAATTSQTNADLESAIEAAGDSNASSGSSILTSVPAASTTVSTNSALGGQQEKDAAFTIGPSEDDAVDFYTEGQRGTIMTRAGGLLTDPDDPALRSRRGLIAG
tara:strand:- start:856 stop:1638 length:783 start_codon:yes stop_codon:yes gene_type:complete